MEDSEIQRLCRAIYSKHQKALDLVFEHRPDRAASLAEALQEILKRPGIVMDHSSKSYVRFIPALWDALPRNGEGWTPTKRLLLFEFDISKGALFLKLVLGPGEEKSRDELHQVITGQPHVFNRASTRLYPKWWSCHIEKWLSAKQLEDSDVSELVVAITQRFDEFVKDRLPTMEGAIPLH